MGNRTTCPRCGGDIVPGSPCPACLLGLGLESVSENRDGGSSSAWTPPSLEELSARFPELELLELLGRGGMGAVYKARQAALDRMVAVKILPPEIGDNPMFADRFAREAKALAKLNHPNIVTIHDFGERDGLYFFMMEFVDGVNLRQLLDTGRVSAREALAIVPQICDALQCAHDQGIVHRDIKPENILMGRQGRVKIADFGLAKLADSVERVGETGEEEAGNTTESQGRGRGDSGPAAVHTLAAVGTPSYMAPEQVNHPGEVDHRADIYALGVVFYQMLTGELPGKELAPPSQRGVQIDVRLDEIVLQALEKDPGRRYSQVSILKTRLEDVTDTPSAKPSAKKSATPTEEQKARPWIWLAVILFLHSCAGGASSYFFIFAVPHFHDMFAGMDVALPVPAHLVVNLTYIVWHRWLLLVPFLLLSDATICLLLTLGRLRKTLIIWGLLILLGLTIPLGSGVIFMFLPLGQSIVDIGRSDAHILGPVIEQVLNDDSEERNWWLDLDNSKLLTPPRQLKNAPEAEWTNWVAENGADISGIKAGTGILFGLNVSIAPMPDAEWESIEPSQIKAELKQHPAPTSNSVSPAFSPVEFGSGQATPSPVYAFQTREGTQGILQILSISSEPRGLRLRFRRVIEKGPDARSPMSDHQDDLRQQATADRQAAVMAREIQNMRAHQAKVGISWAALILCGAFLLVGIPLIIGGAVLSIVDIRRGHAIGGVALLLALGTPLAIFLLIASAYFFRLSIGRKSVILLLPVMGEAIAFIMGFLGRKAPSGKAAMVVAGMVLFIPFLFLLLHVAWS